MYIVSPLRSETARLSWLLCAGLPICFPPFLYFHSYYFFLFFHPTFGIHTCLFLPLIPPPIFLLHASAPLREACLRQTSPRPDPPFPPRDFFEPFLFCDWPVAAALSSLLDFTPENHYDHWPFPSYIAQPADSPPFAVLESVSPFFRLSHASPSRIPLRQLVRRMSYLFSRRRAVPNKLQRFRSHHIFLQYHICPPLPPTSLSDCFSGCRCGGSFLSSLLRFQPLARLADLVFLTRFTSPPLRSIPFFENRDRLSSLLHVPPS